MLSIQYVLIPNPSFLYPSIHCLNVLVHLRWFFFFSINEFVLQVIVFLLAQIFTIFSI